MAAGAVGSADLCAPGAPPTGLGRTPVPEEGRAGVCGGAGRRAAPRVETGRGRRPLLGRGGVVPPRPRPGLAKFWPGMVQPAVWEMNGQKLPAHPESRREGRGTPGDGRCPSRPLCRPSLFSSRPLPRGTCCTPQLGSAPPPFPPSTASLPPQGILGTQSLRGPQRISPWDEKGGTQASCPRRPLRAPGKKGGGAAAAPRGLPSGRRAGLERNIPGSEGWGWGEEGRRGALRPGGISGKPGPGNRALPSHLLREGPKGPGSAVPQALFIPQPLAGSPVLHSRSTGAHTGSPTLGQSGVPRRGR